MRTQSIEILLILALLSTGLISCTRAEDSNVAQVSLSLPKSMGQQKVGALAFDTLSHLVINVTGDGIAKPILFTWDAHEGNSMVAAPSSFQLTVPQGNNRLVQVLAVYSESSQSGSSGGSGAMQFYYGDKLQSFTTTSESLTISVASIGQGSVITSGQIAGRYFDSASSGPTGYVDIIYNPAGKPAMIVERELMMSGWFQVFGLIGAKFSYRAPNGEMMFGGGPVELTDTYFPGSNSLLKVAMPVRSRGYGNNQWGQDEPEVSILGFFGNPAGVSGKVICKDNTSSGQITKSNDYNTPLTVVNAAAPSDLSTPGLPSIYLAGGVAVGTSPCTAAEMTSSLYTSSLQFAANMLLNGKDSSAGFRVPFAINFSGGNMSMVNVTTPDPANKTITGTLLPGVTSVFDQFAMFRKVTSEEFHNDDGIQCSKLVSDFGFTALGNSPVTSSTWTATIPMTAAEATSGVTVVLCPMKNGTMAERGVWLGKWNFSYADNGSGVGGGSNSSLATHIMIKEKPTGMTYDFCSRILIQATDSNGMVAMVNNPFMASATASHGNLYTDSLCTDAVGANFIVYPSGRYMYFVPGNSGSPETLDISYHSGLSSTLISGPTWSFTSAPTTTTNSVAILSDTRYPRHVQECVPFNLVGRDGSNTDGDLNMLTTASAVSLTATGPTATVYADRICATPLTGFSFNAAFADLNTQEFFVRAAVSGSMTVTLQQTSGSSCPGPAPCYSSINGFQILSNSNDPAQFLQINSAKDASLVPPGTCMLMTAEVTDASGWPTTASQSQTVNITINGPGNCQNTSYIALMDSDCTSNTALTKNLNIPMGDNRVVFGLKNVAVSSGVCSVSATLASPSLTSPPFLTNW